MNNENNDNIFRKRFFVCPDKRKKIVLLLILTALLFLLLFSSRTHNKQVRAEENTFSLFNGVYTLNFLPPQDQRYADVWSDYKMLIGDVNGDGNADLIWNTTTSDQIRTYIGLAKGDGTFDYLAKQDNPYPDGGSDYKMLIGDVNGDGNADLIWNTTTSDQNRTYIGLAKGDGTFEFLDNQDHTITNGWSGYKTLVGDVNGDGYTDLIWNTTTSDQNRTYIGLAKGDGTLDFLDFYLDHTIPGGWSDYKTLVGDVNGDGNADLIWNTTSSDQNRTYIGLAKGDGTFDFLAKQDHTIPGGWSDYKMLIGDVNGDGNADLIWNTTTSDQNRIYIGLAKGDGTFDFLDNQDHTIKKGWNGYKTLVGDVNGDGYTDLIWNTTTSDHNRTYIGLANGNGTFNFLVNRDNPYPDVWSDYKTLVGDVNGDGNADLIWNTTTSDQNRIYIGLVEKVELYPEDYLPLLLSP